MINHPDVRDETSAAGKEFRHKFRLPMVKVDKIMNEAPRAMDGGLHPQLERESSGG